MKFLVVGCGSIGRRHLMNLRSLNAGDVAVCDVDAGGRAAAAAGGASPVFDDLDRAMDWRPDAVLVCVPNAGHADVAIMALNRGAHCFIEKPLAHTREAADRLVAAARATRRVVLVGCNMRFHAGVAQLKEALTARPGAGSWIFRAHFGHHLANWRPGRDYRTTYSSAADQGGGIVLDAVHEIDYLGWLGGPIVAVDARGGRVGDLEIDTEDHAHLRLTFASGAIGEVQLDYLRPVKSRGCEIIGPGMVLTWISEGKNPETIRVRQFDGNAGIWKDLFVSEAYDANAMYVDEMRHFIDCLHGSVAAALDADGAREVLALALTAREQVQAQELP
jgi:predicted dehydrogenase